MLFNRFLHPDIDPEPLTVTTGFGLSSPAEGRLPRAWIAHLAGRLRASLAASTGVEDAADVAAYLLAGADVVMTTSSLLRHGPDHAMRAARRADGVDGPQRVHQPERRPRPARRLRGPAAAARERAGYVRSLRAADRGEAPGTEPGGLFTLA